MMQRDTPREGGRREGRRAWTQAAPGAKTQLLLLLMAESDRPAKEETLTIQHWWVSATCVPVSK